MRELFEEAQRYIPGGVNSPVRAHKAVGGDPIFIRSGAGARIRDAEDREYVDYVGSWGPMIVGHTHPRVVAALRDQAGLGTSFGTPSELETELERSAPGVPLLHARHSPVRLRSGTAFG